MSALTHSITSIVTEKGPRVGGIYDGYDDGKMFNLWRKVLDRSH